MRGGLGLTIVRFISKLSYMSKVPLVTVVNNNHIRGVLASADIISKKLLEDMVDFFELSSLESSQETDELIAAADKEQSWMPLGKVRELSNQSE